jgi:hypothetical protein
MLYQRTTLLHFTCMLLVNGYVVASLGKASRCVYYWDAICNKLYIFHPVSYSTPHVSVWLRLSSGTLIQKYSHEEDIWPTCVEKRGLFLNSCHVRKFRTVTEYMWKISNFCKRYFFFSVVLRGEVRIKKKENRRIIIFINFWVFSHILLLLYGMSEHEMLNKLPLSWHVFATYLPFVSIFVLIYLMIVSDRNF